MAASEWKGRTELTSWKEIAEFLEVSVRTAQRYESEMSLPVRRLGGEKGRSVLTSVDDLIEWKKRNAAAPWWRGQRFLQTYSLAATAIILALGFIVARDLARSWRVGNPHHSRWDFATFIVMDDHDREVWRKTFTDRIQWEGVPYAYHGDLDGDGTTESVVPYVSILRDTKGGSLRVYSHKGAELWKIDPQRAVSDRRNRFDAPYVLRSFQVFASPEGDRTRWVVASFVHRYEYPCVIVVADSKGKQRGEYWHSGHLEALHVADLDNDGRVEILAAGTGLANSRAEMKVFDPRNLAGAEVLPANHPNQLQGFPAGTEKATVLFERSRLNRLVAPHNYAYRIEAGTSLGFEVNVSENLNRDKGFLTYVIRPDLTLADVSASASLVGTYQEYSIKNPPMVAFGDADLDALRRGYVVLRPGVNSGPAAVNR